MKKIAAINDLSGFGKCSLTADIPVISAMGVQCCPLPTGVLSNQTGYPDYKCVDFTPYMRDFALGWKNRTESFDGILTGFVGSARQGKIISDFISDFSNKNTVVLVDPVMADDGKIYDSYDSGCVDAVKKLASVATVITPNLSELCILSNAEYADIVDADDDLKLEKVRQMSKKIGKATVTTGIPIGKDEIATAVFDRGKFDIVRMKKIGGSFSGTGDITAAVICARLVNGGTLIGAVKLAVDFVSRSILSTVNDSSGNYDPADGIYFEKHLELLRKDNVL